MVSINFNKLNKIKTTLKISLKNLHILGVALGRSNHNSLDLTRLPARGVRERWRYACIKSTVSEMAQHATLRLFL